jgi:hypothetical protein
MFCMDVYNVIVDDVLNKETTGIDAFNDTSRSDPNWSCFVGSARDGRLGNQDTVSDIKVDFSFSRA